MTGKCHGCGRAVGHDFIYVDTTGNIVQYGGRTMRLSNRETDIMTILVTRQGMLVSAADIEDALYGGTGDPPTRGNLKAHIWKLRYKLKKRKFPLKITCSRDRGYALTVSV